MNKDTILSAFGIEPEKIEATAKECINQLEENDFSEQDIDVFFKDTFDELIEEIKNKDSNKYDVASFNLTDLLVASMQEQTKEFLEERGRSESVEKQTAVQSEEKPAKKKEKKNQERN